MCVVVFGRQELTGTLSGLLLVIPLVEKSRFSFTAPKNLNNTKPRILNQLVGSSGVFRAVLKVLCMFSTRPSKRDGMGMGKFHS